MKKKILTNEQLLTQIRSQQKKINRLEKSVARQFQSEETLKISEKNLSVILENNADGIVIVDMDGIVLYANLAAKKLFGKSNKEFIGYPFGFPVSEDIAESSLVIRKGNDFCDAELRVVKVQWQKKPAFQLSVRDITESKQIEEALRESNELHKSLGQTIPFGLDIVDEDGNILFVSGDFQKQFGAKAIGEKCWTLYRDSKLQCADCPLKTGIELGKTDVYNVQGVLGGKIFEISHTGMMFKGKKALLEIFKDVTEHKQVEKDLQMSENKYRNQANFLNVVIENSPFAMWVSDTKGILIRANQALRNILNLTDDMIIGKYNVLHDENIDTQGFMPVVEAVFNDLKSARFIMFWTGSKVGHVDLSIANEHWIDVAMFPITDEAGKLVNVVCQYVDITELKQVEKTLYETNARHSGMIENIGDVIAIVEADGMTIYQSPNIEKWFGWKPEDLIGTNGWDKMHPEDIDRIQKEFSEMLKKETASIVEYRFKCKDGNYKWIELTAVNRINNPAINGILLNYHDITERKQIEEALKKSEIKYRGLYNSIRDAILVANTDRKIIECNQAFSDLFEYSLSEIKNKETIAVYENEEQFIELGQALKSHSGNANPFLYTVNYKKKSGVVFPGETSIYYLNDDIGNIIGFIGLIRDITERKQAEETINALACFPEENPNPVIRVDINEVVIYANQATSLMFKHHELEVGKKLTGLLHDKLLETILCRKQSIVEIIYDKKILSFFVSPIIKKGYSNIYIQDITERKKAEKNLKQIEWLLTRKTSTFPVDSYLPFYGDLTTLNMSRVILDSIGSDMLSKIAGDYLNLLQTSGAIYEVNGDYALGIFSSGWCKFLDSASYKLCGTDDSRIALNSGKWLCHESCWNEASKASIQKGEPVDIECKGGIHLYAVPIRAGSRIVGSMNFGYGNPPQAPEKLREIADKYRINIDQLRKYADAYETHPPFLIEVAKERLQTSAFLIGEIIERKRMEEDIRKMSFRDELTGLYNRRGFITLGEQQLKLWGRTKKRALLFFADLDGMKWINDTLKHKEGDKALIKAASIINETFRSSDIIARIGGDEFAVLAINSKEIDPVNIIKRFQKRIDKYNNQADSKYKLSISIGSSFYDPENPSSIDELMAGADKLMYEQKKNKKPLI